MSTTTFSNRFRSQIRRCLWLVFLMPLALTGCTGLPEGVEPVVGFEQSRYLGKWHEIARLDHSFERGLIDVTAEYRLSEDGDIQVINSGTDMDTGERESAEGLAKFVGSPDVGHLKVSFFGPFYGSYIIFELGENYDYAFVSGYNTDYLWLLARTPTVSEELKERFVRRAQDLGFDLDELVWPVAARMPAP